MRTRKVKAWLVTWEWSGDHAGRDDKVAAILNPRLRSERVRQIVEFVYLSQYCLSERIAFMVHPEKNPYPAKLLNVEGLPWEGEIHCGYNPFLRARLVDDLVVRCSDDGKEVPSWKERYDLQVVRHNIAAHKKSLSV